jgi:penicillin-binding protein 2
MKPIRITNTHQSITFSRRMLVLGGAQVAVGGLLIGRLGWLAIAENEKYQLLSESNRVQLIPVPPRRGWIIDRYGKPIAINKASFRVDLIPQQMDKSHDIVPEVAQLLDLDSDDIDRIRRDLAQSRGFQPVSVADNVPYEQYAAITVRLPDLPGVAASQGFTRFYPGGSTVGQLVGYVGPASVEEYEKENKNPLLLVPGVKIGKEGLEKTLEPVLRGQPGGQRVEVTARGKIVKELDPKPDISGGTVRLTIDSDLHQFAARRIGDNSGSVVVMDIETGDILAMPSMPSFDPNNFSDGISQAEWKMLSDDDHLPLVDKVLESLYPSGSTIKPSMALAFLKQGIDPKRTVHCTGSYPYGNHVFHCDKAHGTLDMHDAIKHSCDIFFYDTGLRANPELTADMVNYMGYGEKFDLPFASQRFGTMPSPKWLMEKYHQPWHGYDTINMSIGQGYVLINPLQLAVMATRIASGNLVEPRILASAPRRPIAPLQVDPQHLAFVRDAMTAVVNDGGTAAASKLPVPNVLMAGKTGTAQVHRLGANERGGHESSVWQLRDHALFIGFAPADKPKYAIGCLIEHGGFGASAAAPVVKDTMTYLFDKQMALTALAQYEQTIGGPPDVRLAKKTAAWRQANGFPPLPPNKQA